jgi:hypothetical protein
MSKMHVLSGYMAGEAPLASPYQDYRLMCVDQSEGLERHDAERMGCPLHITTSIKCDGHEPGREGNYGEIGELQLSFSTRDFRDLLDRDQCACDVGEIYKIRCTEHDVEAFRASPFADKIVCKVRRIVDGVWEFVAEMAIDVAIALGLVEEDEAWSGSAIC